MEDPNIEDINNTLENDEDARSSNGVIPEIITSDGHQDENGRNIEGKDDDLNENTPLLGSSTSNNLTENDSAPTLVGGVLAYFGSSTSDSPQSTPETLSNGNTLISDAHLSQECPDDVLYAQPLTHATPFSQAPSNGMTHSSSRFMI